MFSAQEFLSILQWWFPIFILGLIFFPSSSLIFDKFIDRGYLFSKVLAFGLVSYTVFVLNVARILPFNLITIFLITWIFSLLNLKVSKPKEVINKNKSRWKLFVFEEILFLVGIIVWTYVRVHEPSINGLEKFMDFGFINSILRSTYQPAVDMWFPPHPINYYYFGHFTTAVLTKLSFLPSYVTYNLMLATIFSFTFGLSFSLGLNFISKSTITRKSIIGGILSGALVSLGGNLHTIYALFKPYNVDNPISFFSLVFSPQSIPNNYWYPNATRFIPLTIHEFPLYSFVVSDLHGHVIDIPFVLLTIAVIYVIFLKPFDSKSTSIQNYSSKFKILNFIPRLFTFNFSLLTLLALLLAIMYMTNAWDGLIYILLLSIVIFIKNAHHLKIKKVKSGFLIFKNRVSGIRLFLVSFLRYFLSILLLFTVFSLPFNLHFKPFAQGIGLLCAPNFLVKIQHIGPLLFEANHCQRSPLWQLLILHGFFFFFAILFIFFIAKRIKKKVLKEDILILLLILVSSILIVTPEIVYLKDIYPAHYRANTMFKLVYQAFIMLSLVSAYSIVRIVSTTKNLLFYLASFVLLIPVFIYPYFAVKSYYGDLKNYIGIDGIIYLRDRYPEDYEAIIWIEKNISGRPVIVEAQGDSYTDYGRISANTGLPTILGWTVHEWLWRGSYDIPAPRIEEVRLIYESENLAQTRRILNKYNVEYIYVGKLEREKYINLKETKFEELGDIVFSEGQTKIYKVTQ